MTVLPVKSTRAAPRGTCTSTRRPTEVNRLFSTMNAEFSMALPSPVMSRAPSNTVTSVVPGAWPFTWEELPAAKNRHAANSK